MINRQCDNCAKQGKNFYCNACDKTAEFFDIHSYYINRTSKNSLIGGFKAYTWHDVLEFVRYNFFHHLSGDLKVDCEKEFAYIERKISNQKTENYNKEIDPLGYKIYLNKDKKLIEDAPRVGGFWDLTLLGVNTSRDSKDLN
jgi:hypothetical protein